jgi:ribosomal protein S18 acetylase RimI-like enzyme
VSQFEIRALSSETWSAFVDLCDRHNGAGFGCWCTWFHWETHSAPGTSGVPRTADETRDFKRRLVETGRAHAALVFDGEAAVGWAQYGSPDELPGISHRKEVQAAGSSLPDWRITCIFVDRRYRHRGIARTALDGALELILQAGGGTVESYPQDTEGKKVSASFLYNATRSTFEQAGFTYDRPKGKNHCIMRTTVSGHRVGSTESETTSAERPSARRGRPRPAVRD